MCPLIDGMYEVRHRYQHLQLRGKASLNSMVKAKHFAHDAVIQSVGLSRTSL